MEWKYNEKDFIDLTPLLKKYKETDNLVNAVEAGISSDDLHKDNIGVNKSGNIVVIDC